MTRDETPSYYEAIAPEYDLAYAGKGPAIGGLSEQYARDIGHIVRLLNAFGEGHLVDLACGTAHWLPHYAPNCSRITLVDQSDAMLEKSRERIERLGLLTPVTYLEGDVIDCPLESSVYDSAVVGFLVSHLTPEQEDRFFDRLGQILKSGATLAIFDSVWSDVRRPHRTKEGYETRTLTDGRSFSVLKRYFEPTEFESMLTSRGFDVTERYVGDLFIAAVSKKSG